MAIRSSRARGLAQSRVLALVCALMMACAFSLTAALPASAAESRSLTIPGSAFSQEADGTFLTRIVTDPFDRVAVFWDSDQNPVVSVRVISDGAEAPADWQPIQENGQVYLHHMGGLFDFSRLGSTETSVAVEIRIEKNEEAGLRQFRLEFMKETSDTVSTIVLVIVMAAAGGVLYLKKKKTAAP